jgi:hypothetical protein
MSKSTFSAQEPSLGYHYQVRYGLYLLLNEKEKDDPFIKLENLDDVEIGDLNHLELHQTKFHNAKAASLTDSSVDFWKTIRVWSDMILEKKIDLDNVLLVLVTTSATSEKSVLYELTNSERDIKTIKNIILTLNKITKESKNEKLEAAFIAFNKLTSSQKEKLVQSIHIRDKSLTFDGLKLAIQKQLRLAIYLQEHIEIAYPELEGWWYEQCIQHLLQKKDKISFEETRHRIAFITDKLKNDNLPIDNTLDDVNIEEDEYNDRTFVHQLRNINIGKKVVQNAKKDFYKASEQRFKWLRERLLNPAEEIEYEKKIYADWERKFGLVEDEIDDSEMDEHALTQLCKTFFTRNYVSSVPQIFIRPKVTDSFITSGSSHMLADQQRIVWHPKFKK